MQIGGGPRNEEFNLGDVFQPFINEFRFTGLPPFISSGGVFTPEIYFFKIGLTTSGILILWLVFRLHWKNGILPFNGLKSRIISCISGTIVGLSLIGFVHFSFIEDPLIHSYFAGAIFTGGLTWLASVHISTKTFDKYSPVMGINLIKARQYSLGIAVFCWVFMPIPLLMMKLQFAAVLEWTMMLSLQFGVLTLEPLLNSDTKL